MKRLFNHLTILLLGLMLLSFTPPKGTWYPLDDDRVALQEELTFTTDSLYWKTGFTDIVFQYQYEIRKDSIFLKYPDGVFAFHYKVSGPIMQFGNHRYRYKIPRSK